MVSLDSNTGIIMELEKRGIDPGSNDLGFVSIVIPNYNHAEFLDQAIQSVLNQTYPHYEIIVVDDGSTDKSRKVLEQFGDMIRPIFQENQGLSAARNRGLRAATGKYIGLLDADDLYEPDFLKFLLSKLHARPEAQGIYCGYRFVDEKNIPLPQIETREILEGELYNALLDGNFLVPESMLVHRKCYDEAGDFDTTLNALEDWDMWLRISQRSNIIGTTQILTRHRVVANSMSSDPKRMLENRLSVIEKHFGRLDPNGGNYNKPLRRVYGRAYLAGSVEYLQVGDQENSFICFRTLAELSPALLEELDTYYQLGCGMQPKGYMGDPVSLDLGKNANILLMMLDRLFNSGGRTTSYFDYRSTAYATAYLALGQLSYSARNLQTARKYIRRSWTYAPVNIIRWGILSIYLKTFLSKRLVDYLNTARQRGASRFA